MKRFIKLLLICSLIISSTVVYAQPSQENTKVDEGIVEQYISSFLSEGYSNYYKINKMDVNVQDISFDTDNNKVEAIVLVTMNNVLKVQKVEELPLIKGMEKKSDEMVKENDINKDKAEKILKDTKDSVQEYIGKSDDYNFSFMYEANIKDNNIDLSSSKLLFKNDDKYIPAEDILPKQEATLENDGYNQVNESIIQSEKEPNSNSIQPLAVENAYDRVVARDYANYYSSNASAYCPHGSGNGALQDINVWDNQYYPYYSQFCHNDCADFLSQALAHGGIPKVDGWNGWGTRYTQTTWVRANEVPQYVVGNGYFYLSNWTDTNAGGFIAIRDSGANYEHVMMVVQNDTVTRLYSAHTNDRYRYVYTSSDSSWDYYRCYQ